MEADTTNDLHEQSNNVDMIPVACQSISSASTGISGEDFRLGNTLTKRRAAFAEVVGLVVKETEGSYISSDRQRKKLVSECWLIRFLSRFSTRSSWRCNLGAPAQR